MEQVVIQPDNIIYVNDQFLHDNKNYIITKIVNHSDIYVRMITEIIHIDPHFGAEFKWTKDFNDVKWLR